MKGKPLQNEILQAHENEEVRVELQAGTVARL